MPVFSTDWKIGKPDAVVAIPVQTLQASGPDEYSYITVPTNFHRRQWVIAAELRPAIERSYTRARIRHRASAEDGIKRKGQDPAAEYGNWLLLHKGTLDYMRPDAPVINDGCAVDDNGKFPGSEQTT